MQPANPPTIPFDDYVAISGAAKAMGLDAALKHYEKDMVFWTQVASQWNDTIGREMHRYSSFGTLVEQEAARISAGGAPRVLGTPWVPLPTPPPQQPYPGQQQTFDQQAAQAGREVGTAAVAGFSAIGAALGSFGDAVVGMVPGARVMVTWSDGNRYPGTIAQVGNGQYLITMQNGQQHWIAQGFVARVG